MSLAFLADIGTNSAKSWRCCISRSHGASSAAPMHLVELVGDQQRRDARLEQRQHLGVAGREAAGLDHEQHQVDVADRAQHGLVQRPVQRRGVPRLEARRVDEDELRVAQGADAGDAVPRGLRLARGDADLLADQGIEQRRLADVGLADDGDDAAALAFGPGRCRRRLLRLLGVHLVPAFRVSSAAAAAACSPARRDAPMPRSVMPRSGISHSTSKVCLWAAPSVPATR